MLTQRLAVIKVTALLHIFLVTSHIQAQDLGSLVIDSLQKMVITPLETLERQFKDFPQVYRIQFRVHTSKRKGADTNDWIRVGLAPNIYTYLDLPGDDFERGSTTTYDLMLTDNTFRSRINRLEDIQYLEITKEGDTPDWAITSFQLLVNGQVVHDTQFEDRKWLGSYHIPGATLRNSPSWRDWKAEPPSFRFSRGELEQRAAAYLGHFFHESPQLRRTKIRWGDNGKGIVISRVADDTVRVHLDLLKVINNAPNPDFDLEVDIRFSQQKDHLQLQILNVNLQTDGFVASAGSMLFKEEVREAKQKLQRTLSGKTVASLRYQFVPFYFHVHENGDLELKSGRDPMAIRRLEEAKTFEQRQEREVERQRLQRQKNGQLEP